MKQAKAKGQSNLLTYFQELEAFLNNNIYMPVNGI
jgi:hypothetical protein